VIGDPAVLGGAQGTSVLFLVLPVLVPCVLSEDAHEALLGDPSDQLLRLQAQMRADQSPRAGIQGDRVGERFLAAAILVNREIPSGERIVGVRVRRCRL